MSLPYTADDLRQYVQSIGWAIVPEALDDRLFILNHPTNPIYQLLFSSDTNAPDYERSLELAVQYLAEILQVPVFEIESRLVRGADDTLKARLTFNGAPVRGTHAIAADFGAKATGAFSDIYTAFAAALTGNLNYMGRIPGRDQNQLYITATAHGSFGFEFKIPSHQPNLFKQSTIATEAIEKVETLLRLAAVGSDDDVTELVSSVHPRAAKKVYEFLNLLVQEKAWCGLEHSGKFFRYENLQQVEYACSRLQESNIKEETKNFIGEFHGVLPNSRTFEFAAADQSNIIRGKIDPSFDDPDILNREWLHKLVSINLYIVQVGQARPRFTLISLDDVKLDTTYRKTSDNERMGAD